MANATLAGVSRTDQGAAGRLQEHRWKSRRLDNCRLVPREFRWRRSLGPSRYRRHRLDRRRLGSHAAIPAKRRWHGSGRSAADPLRERLGGVSTEPSTLRRVAKNTAVPTATSIVNKGLDLVFAVVLARSLGPTALGPYTWSVLVVGYFDILVNFGLGILIARQVARDAASAPRYMGAAAVARASLWLVSLAASLVIAGPLAGPIGITPEMGIALAVFTVGIGVSNLSGICSAVFNGREMMEYPALVTV